MDRRKFVLSSLASVAAYAVQGEYCQAPAETTQQASAPLEPLPRNLQLKLAQDPLRPQFHLLPRHNWMNDPCAPRFHKGTYHMFFQYNPHAPVWGDMHWNHATSPDLIHWKHQPIAIAPGPSAFDAYGIFTGSVLPGTDVATVLYTGVSRSSPEQETIRKQGLREVQCLATSVDPELRVWQKLEAPVIDGPPPGLKVTGFRDPCPWKDGDIWYLAIGSGFAQQGGAVLLYSSKDGRKWEYLHPLAEGKWNSGSKSDPVDTGEMWECPDFFALGDKHVLLYSTERKVYWQVGRFDKQELRFHKETSGLLDHGSYYAMKSMVDEKGRRILWGWVEETRSADACTQAGWAGCMALPRVLSVGPDNRLRMEVPPEFASLQLGEQTFPAHPNAGEADAWIAKQAIQNRAGKVVYTFKPGHRACGLEMRESTSGSPLFAISHGGSGSPTTVMVADKILNLAPSHDGVSTVELWIDGSVIEIFVDKQEALTLRNYSEAGGTITIAWTGDVSALHSMGICGITPISDDRLTS
jgi:beta-fructofuranosidase